MSQQVGRPRSVAVGNPLGKPFLTPCRHGRISVSSCIRAVQRELQEIKQIVDKRTWYRTISRLLAQETTTKIIARSQRITYLAGNSDLLCALRHFGWVI